MKRIILLIFFLLIGGLSIDAQARNCGTMEHLDYLKQQDPNLDSRMMQIEQHTNKFLKNSSQEKAAGIITIPVVVHILHRTNAENISDAQVLSQIDVLNEDFRRTNADANGKWSQAADIEIEFCMATVDPNGNATDGINRKSTTKRSWRTNDDMKKSSKGGVDPWPTDQYLNMWVCNLANGILGYAQFPGGSAATDGVVMLYNAFGRVGTLNSTYNLGRTTTHEVGHWLNLRHIWGDGGCSVDDYVSDTPESDGANYGCATSHSSCGSADMVENYMDYSDDGCMNLFTSGQKSRMRALFAAGGFRAALANSAACGGSTGGGGGGDPTPTCNDGMQNGDETGVDCGGSCTACDTGGGGDTGGSCDAPTGLASSPAGKGKKLKANLSWDAVSGASSYTVELRTQGGSWSSGSTTGTSIQASGISSGTVYEWRVQADCSDWSAIASFVGGQSGRLAEGAEGETTPLSISVYPNPAVDQINVTYDNFNANEVLTLSVYDIWGRLVSQERVTPNTFQNSKALDISGLNSGSYIIHLDNGQEQATQKFVVF